MMLPFNKRRTTVRYLLFIFILLNILIPVLLTGLNNTTSSNFANNPYKEGVLKTQSFSKDDYKPILDEEKQALGDINITDLKFDEIGINSSEGISSKYEEYKDDLSTDALNMSYRGTNFNSTIRKAQDDNINENITDYRQVTVLLNESISVQYNETQVGYLYYAPRLTPFLDAQLWVKNDTGLPLQEVNEGNYSIEKIDGINFLRFNYKDYFMYNNLNFTMHLLWEYNVSINPWKLTQDFNQELLLDEDEDYLVNPTFHYEFKIVGRKYKYDNQTKTYEELPADNLEVNLTINLPDKELLWNLKLKINSINQDNFLNPDKSITPKGLVEANNSQFEISFSASYGILFVDPVKDTWAIDRLVEDTDIRERIYFPYIHSGPKRIYIKYANIIEKTVSFGQVIEISSLFGRTLSYEEVNVTEFEEDIKNSLIFSENATKKAGIKITLPYLIKGEICPFTIKYETDLDLKIKVTDNIRMPIAGLDVKIYYYGELYGTYISNGKNQPIGTTITDENGEILVKDVPNGNYTIKIYQGETLVKEAEVSAYIEINYVITPIIHFPFVIMILGSIYGLIFGIGYYIYRKQK